MIRANPGAAIGANISRPARILGEFKSAAINSSVNRPADAYARPLDHDSASDEHTTVHDGRRIMILGTEDALRKIKSDRPEKSPSWVMRSQTLVS